MFPHTLPPLHRPKAHHNHPKPLFHPLSFWDVILLGDSYYYHGPNESAQREREDRQVREENKGEVRRALVLVLVL
jgi:hypothetical protein